MLRNVHNIILDELHFIAQSVFNKILSNKLGGNSCLSIFYCQVQNVTGHHVATNLDKKIKSCCSVDDKFIFLNLTIYEFMMIQQTISQQCVLCWAKRELFAYPAMFPHFPEHLGSRYVIFLCMCYHGT